MQNRQQEIQQMSMPCPRRKHGVLRVRSEQAIRGAWPGQEYTAPLQPLDFQYEVHVFTHAFMTISLSPYPYSICMQFPLDQ